MTRTPSFRLPLLLVVCALASACATTGKQAVTPTPDKDVAVVADVAAQTPDASTPDTSAETVADVARDAQVQAAEASDDAVASADADVPSSQDAAATSAETDFDAIYGDASGTATAPAAFDPWEKYNRKVHAFNSAVDRRIAKPLAQAYVAVVPQPIRRGVHNVFQNLEEPITIVNSVLQGNPRGAANALGRFLLNSTLGIGGVFDIASSKAKMPDRGEDFGQTMAVWGWKRSRYLELPFLGPRTLRDVVGLAGDWKLRPLGYVKDDKSRIFLQGAQLVDMRAQVLSFESLGEGATDEYALFRDIWLQRRNYQINQAGRRDPQQVESDLPPYLQEDAEAPKPASAGD
ncbi:MAG: VacJ family lipoprotein [Thermomonas sp.]